MAKIDKITIEGFKSIQAVEELPLTDLNILIGPNGAGKSNFISVFNFLTRMADLYLKDMVARAGGADKFLYFGSKITDYIYIHIWYGQSYYSCKLVPTQDDNLIIASEDARIQVKDGRGLGHELHLEEAHIESMLIPHAEDFGNVTAKEALELIQSWRIYHFLDTSNSARVRKKCNINDNAYLRQDGSNLAACLYLFKEKHENSYKSIIDTIRLVASFFNDFDLRPDPLNNDTILLEWKHIGTDAYFNVSSLSDGTLRFICLATLLLQPNPPSIIIIDEPELGLHPYAITILAGMLKTASKRTQIIVSTQSVTLVDHFAPEDIVVVEMENNETVMKRLSSKELASWLEDYTIGELWEKNIFGGRPK